MLRRNVQLVRTSQRHDPELDITLDVWFKCAPFQANRKEEGREHRQKSGASAAKQSGQF